MDEVHLAVFKDSIKSVPLTLFYRKGNHLREAKQPAQGHSATKGRIDSSSGPPDTSKLPTELDLRRNVGYLAIGYDIWERTKFLQCDFPPIPLLSLL